MALSINPVDAVVDLAVFIQQLAHLSHAYDALLDEVSLSSLFWCYLVLQAHIVAVLKVNLG